MARQRLGAKKVARYRKETGLDVLSALVRGNTGHRVDLLLGDGSVAYLFPDGEIEKASSLTWDVESFRRKASNDYLSAKS